MSAKGGSDGGGDSAGGGSSPSGGGSAAGGGSAGNILNTVLHQLFPFWFHFLINLPGTNWFIGFCGQRDFSITRLYLLWIEKTPSGDFKGEQPNVGNEIHHVDPSTSQWGLSDNLSKNPKKEPGIHYHYRNFYQGLPIIVVPILSMMNHFILLTDQYIYFFRINSQNKLEVIHRIEASSEAERRLYKSCAISANGQIMVVHHDSGFSVFRINMNFGQFQVDLIRNVELPQPSRAFPFMSFLGDVNQVEMSGSGVVVVYESSHFSNGAEPVIKILLQNEGSIHRFPLRGIKEIPSGQPIKSVKLCQISRTKIRVILGSIDFVVLLILDLGREVSLCFGAILNLGFEIQQICPCSVNPTHFFVAGKKIERSGEILLGYEKCRLTPVLIEIAIREGALVNIDKKSFDKGGVSECSYLTSSGGIVIASFIGKDYRARESVIGETRKVESSVPPSLSRSTLNGAPIQLEPRCVFTLLSCGEIVASNADNGLTLFGTDCKPIASEDAHKSLITSVFSLEVGGIFVVSFSHSDGSIKIWSIQKRGKTVHNIRIVATIATADLVQKKGVKFLAFYGKMLLILTNQEEFLRFHIEIIGGIRVEIRPIFGPVVQIPSGKICQSITAVNSTHALIHFVVSGVRRYSLVLVSFLEGADEVFKTIGTREFKEDEPVIKPPAALTLNSFAVSAVVPTTVCSTALEPGEASCSFTPKDFNDGKLCNATILAIFPCESGFICITANGFLFQYVYDAQQKPFFKNRIDVLKCSLTPKCRLQVSGNTVMVCQPRDDGSFELLTFPF